MLSYHTSSSGPRISPLHIDECTLRNKNWVELIPRHPDVDVIADRLFDSRGGKNKTAKVFSPKQGVELVLSISHELYESIQDHIEAKEAKHVSATSVLSTILVAD